MKYKYSFRQKGDLLEGYGDTQNRWEGSLGILASASLFHLVLAQPPEWMCYQHKMQTPGRECLLGLCPLFGSDRAGHLDDNSSRL